MSGGQQKSDSAMKSRFSARLLDRAIGLLKIPPPGTPQLLRRIRLVERDIILPLKLAGIAMLLYSFYSSPWFKIVLTSLDIAIESTLYFLWVYIGFNIIVAALLMAMHRLPQALLEWVVFTSSLVDGIFLSALTLVTGGPDSILYYLFLAMIVRSAASVPRATSQLMLNFTLIAYYALTGVINIFLAETLIDPVMETPINPTEHVLLRVLLLVLMTLCCYAAQVLLERQRYAMEQGHEFAMREAQLQSAGRLAAEIAHQIKNPLAIINNAAFSLQRALKDARPAVVEQIQIIQEEVERSDRIITQIMGYAQLSEGRVEKLDVAEELERAIEQVFPARANFPIEIHRNYSAPFPPLFMQRRHVAETFMNVLQNAREALEGRTGNVFIEAHCNGHKVIEISIRDDGPGISREKQEQIFEAYYTTREKGTGLGLAMVKHNMELYGGQVRVESELGKGARFTLLFPLTSLMRLAKQS
jgi:signal transduction histidine kinase